MPVLDGLSYTPKAIDLEEAKAPQDTGARAKKSSRTAKKRKLVRKRKVAERQEKIAKGQAELLKTMQRCIRDAEDTSEEAADCTDFDTVRKLVLAKKKAKQARLKSAADKQKALSDQVAKKEKPREPGRRYTEEGYPIYTEEELNIGKGGNTPLCPFDCDCCF